MRRDIHLHGVLATKFAPKYTMDVANPAEAVRALCYQLPGFRRELETGAWHVISCRPGQEPLQSGRACDEKLLRFNLASRADLHIVPAVAGSNGGLKALLGVTLVALSFVVPGVGLAGFLWNAGLGIGLSGLADLLAPKTNLKGGRSNSRKESFLFGTAGQVSEQGRPVPLIFGTCFVDGNDLPVISAGISTETIPPPTSGLFSPWVTGSGSGSGAPKAGQGAQSSPFDYPNTLQSRARASLVYLMGEGPQGGLVDGLKSLYLDETPVQNSDGTYNYNNVIVEQRPGDPDQAVLSGFPDVQTPVSVNVEVRQNTPVTRTISDLNADAARVAIRVPSLLNGRNNNNPKTSVDIRILLQSTGGSFEQVIYDTIGPGKTTSGYEREYRIELTGDGPWNLRVERVTADSTDDRLQNQTFWSSYTLVVDQRLTYPNSALLAISGDAESWGGNIPRMRAHWRGIELDVPTNLDTETRTYSGVWDGEFKRAIFDDPAWVLWYLCTNRIGGLGEVLRDAGIGKWELQHISAYFNEMVPDGYGGMEPRVTFNGAITNAEESWKLLQEVASTMRALIYYGAGRISFAADMPTEPEAPINQANVVDGLFNYSSTPLSEWYSAVHVTWYNQQDQGRPDVEVVEDPALIERIGRKVKEVVALGCTSRGQAARVGRWELETQRAELAKWQASFDQAARRPGDVIPVVDPAYQGIRRGGRILEVINSGYEESPVYDGIVLDAPVTLMDGEVYSIMITMPDGSAAERVLDLAPGVYTTLSFDEPLEEAPIAGAVWALSGSLAAPRLFRVHGIRETASNIFEVKASFYDPNKYDRIELGLVLDDTPFSLLPTGPLAPPSFLSVLEELVLVGGVAPGQRVTLSWQAPDDPRVGSYEVWWMAEGFSWERVVPNAPNTSADIFDIGNGRFFFRVRSVDGLGRVSAFSQIGPLLLSGQTSPPPDVEQFRVAPLGDLATLTWLPVDAVNLSHYEIRYSPDTVGAQYNSSSILLPQVTGTSAQVPTLTGTYFIKAVTLQGVRSVNPAVIVSTISALQNFNAVESFAEQPAWGGTRTHVVVDNTDALRLDTEDDIGDWPSLEVVPEMAYGVGGGLGKVGQYQLISPVDLSEVYTSRVTVLLRTDGTNDLESIASWTTLSEVATLAGVEPSEWSVILEMRTTLDDPNDIEAVWSDWDEFRTGDYTARGFDFRLRLESFRVGVSPRVTAFEVSIDMPDRIIAQDDIEVPLEGVRIDFIPPFKRFLGLGIANQDLDTGDYAEITNKDESGFDVAFFDANGDPVARTLDYVAKGYGRVLV